MNIWEKRFDTFLNIIINSDLYNYCNSINLVVVYDNDKDLKKVQEKIQDYKKIQIYSYRKFSDKQALPHNLRSFNPAESESIIKMINHAKNSEQESYYLFLHAKSVTNKWKERLKNKGHNFNKQVANYLLNKKGNEFYTIDDIKNMYPVKLHDRFVEELHREVIDNWQEHVQKLQYSNYSHWWVNFFWIRSELLEKFSMNDYCKKVGNVRFPHTQKICREINNSMPTDRHFTALFPYKMDYLYGKAEDNYFPYMNYKNAV